MAIKVLDLDSGADEIAEVEREIRILCHCVSDHITRYRGSFLSGSKLWLVMDYAGGGSIRDLVGLAETQKQSRTGASAHCLTMAIFYPCSSNRDLWTKKILR